MLFGPSFLSDEDLNSFKKDICIFCNSKFNIKMIEKTGEEKRGSHYSEHYVDVLYRTFLISDLDVYSFKFEFDEESLNYLDSKENEIVEKIKTHKQEEAPRLKKKLESKFSSIKIAKKQKEIAIDAIIDDYLAELHNSSGEFGKTGLGERISNLFYNLKLGDLSLIFKDTYSFGDYSLSSDNPKFNIIRCYCKPHGLKTHKKCWPFEDFDGSTSFSIKYRQFFNDVIQNPLFEKYESLFKKFPNLLEDVLEKTNIVIDAKTYKPADYI